MAAPTEDGKDGHVETPMEVLSASGLNTFMACNYKFWLTYGPLKKREPGTPATVRGTLVHKVAEDIRDLKITGSRQTWKTEIMEAAKNSFETRWGSYKSLHTESAAFKEQSWQMVRNFVNSIITECEAVATQKPEFGMKTIFGMVKPKTEVRFNLIEKHGVHGTADEVIEKSDEEIFLVKQWTGESVNDEVIISDLKTSKIFKIAWTEEYERQLKFYCYLYFLKYGRLPSYGVIKFLAHAKESYMKFRLADVEEIKALVNEIQAKARSDYGNESAWKPNTDYQFCKYCWHGKQKLCLPGWERWHKPEPTPGTGQPGVPSETA